MIEQKFIRYRQEVAELARRALRPLKPRVLDGAPAGSLLLAIPAALILLDERDVSCERLRDSAERLAQASTLTDGAGHSRDVYLPLARHLHLLALRQCAARMSESERKSHAAALTRMVGAMVPAAAPAQPPDPEHTALALWQALCQCEAVTILTDHFAAPTPALSASRPHVPPPVPHPVPHPVHDAVDAIIRTPGPDGSLHPLTDGQSLDAWTYQELTGLHALTHLALNLGNFPWLSRVQEIAIYHLENTQPDHTTNQPWGLPAFLLWERTTMFAQQQIHDATAHGLGVADCGEDDERLDLVTGLLLADAACLLARNDLAAMAEAMT